MIIFSSFLLHFKYLGIKFGSLFTSVDKKLNTSWFHCSFSWWFQHSVDASSAVHVFYTTFPALRHNKFVEPLFHKIPNSFKIQWCGGIFDWDQNLCLMSPFLDKNIENNFKILKRPAKFYKFLIPGVTVRSEHNFFKNTKHNQ